MPISQQELGHRLRTAREACRMTQDDVARHLEVSRATVTQMELGNRTITGLELDRLAYLFGRDIREFLAETFHDEDALVALFRADPDVVEQKEVVDAIRRCLALGREVTHLERLLGIDRDLGRIATYPLPTPRGKWDAVQHGARVADEERRRLGLGIAPLADVAEILETQGVRTVQANLPEDVSGLTLSDASVGLFVIANRQHHLLRRRFSYAHEYAHVLLDRERRGTISRAADRDALIEVRANAFAAHFLMPDAGVQQFIAALGKGAASRQHAEVFDESGVVRALARARPGSQAIQMYDVVQLAYYFVVSRLAAIYRLHNLRLITEAELAHLKAQEEIGMGKEMSALLELPEPDHKAARNAFRHRFVSLGLEALRRGEITWAKLEELAQMADLQPAHLAGLLHDLGFDAGEGVGDVLIPEG
jgi:Zn-dependent peptidase ImmA (M78 family)/transcriptional regulator with XRE-family HTH domain